MFDFNQTMTNSSLSFIHFYITTSTKTSFLRRGLLKVVGKGGDVCQLNIVHNLYTNKLNRFVVALRNSNDVNFTKSRMLSV